MTIDEELSQLEDSIRRLKLDYDVYFGGGSKKPPLEADARVQSIIKKYADAGRMNFAQRFRYNTMAQRYALYAGLWQQKLKIKDEGYRRPQDAVLGIQGMRIEQEQQAAAELNAKADSGTFTTAITDVENDRESVERLFQAMVAARSRAVDKAAAGASLESFKVFVKKKTEQLRQEYKCNAVEYSVETEGGQVKLKAKAKQ